MGARGGQSTPLYTRGAVVSAASSLSVHYTLQLLLLAAAVPPLTSSSSLNCSLLPATDCTGGDIGNHAAATPADCCAICAANPACSAFAHNADVAPPTCFFKSGCATKTPAPAPTTAGIVARPPVGSPCIGTISMVGEDGSDTAVHVMQSGGSSGTARLGERSITLRHGGFRVYLTRTCADTFAPASFERFSLLGKSLSFSVDLRNVSCGCNAAMYLTPMGIPGQRATVRKDYSCDANAASENLCPEFDVHEANARATQTTLHGCDGGPPGGNWSNCEQGGRAAKPAAAGLFDTAGSVIRTAEPFRVSVAFQAAAAALGGAERGVNGTLGAVEVTYSQGGRNFTLVPSTDAAYLANLTQAIADGLVAQMSLWGGAASAMNWLDAPPCGPAEDCNPNAVATWSDFAIHALPRRAVEFGR
jgi:hypothetical protein